MYEKQEWSDVYGETPFNADRMKHIEDGIYKNSLDNVYSTDEVFTGKYWKDGKKTYKRTYTGTLDIQVTSSSKPITDIPTNIDTFIKKEGNFIWDNNVYEQDFPLVWGNNSCVLRKVGNQIHYFSNMGIGTGIYNITIEYTKTTD